MPYPSLTPTYGLGSGARTGFAVAISSPRSKIGSQGRIYAYYKTIGLGDWYVDQLRQQLGVEFMPRNINPLSIIQF